MTAAPATATRVLSSVTLPEIIPAVSASAPALEAAKQKKPRNRTRFFTQRRPVNKLYSPTATEKSAELADLFQLEC